MNYSTVEYLLPYTSQLHLLHIGINISIQFNVISAS